jgi:hypothetical protein
MRELNQSDINRISGGLTEQAITAGAVTIHIVWGIGVLVLGITLAFLLED